jgi:membrane fusion protein (multidrug efflux system)
LQGGRGASPGRPGPGQDRHENLKQLLVRFFLLVAIPAAAIVVGIAFYLHGGRYVTTENAYVKADIAQVSADVAGRVVELNVQDHAPVTAGQVLIRLDPEPYQLALAKAEADLQLARHEVETMRAAYREALTELREAEAHQSFTEKNLLRQRALQERGATAMVRLEDAAHDANIAREKVNVARQKVQKALAALGGEADLPYDRHPHYLEAKALRDRARFDLDKTTLVAPITGIAANVRVQPGEYLKAATPVFSVIGSERLWVEANLKETELTWVRTGQLARIVVDAYPDIEWEAEVESISPAAGSEFALLPPQNASGNWVKVVQRVPVKLKLQNPAAEPPLRAGMTAKVSVDTGRQRTLAQLIGSVIAAVRPTGPEPAPTKRLTAGD